MLILKKENKMEKINIKEKDKVITSKKDLKLYNVVCRQKNIPVEYYLNSDRFVINPVFQRHFVWTNQQKSRLIETILSGLIMPAIYVYLDHETNKYLVIDGQQRLTTIKKFVNKEFTLSGLEETVYNDLNYFTLPKDAQDRFKNHDLNIIAIENVDSKDILFKLFKRFNTGATKLNAQELRNCVYSGKFNNLIQKLTDYEPFNKLFKSKEIDRMQKEECVLRFCAFYEDFDNYKSDVNKFLDDYFEEKAKMNSLTDEMFEIKTNDLVSKFKKAIDLSIAVFGFNAFKYCDKNNKMNKVSYRSFSKSVYDMQMLGFVNQDAELIIRHKDKIKQRYEELVINDEDMRPSYKKMSRKAVEYRINKWNKEISKLVQNP